MRQLQGQQQQWMALEELRVALQILRNGIVREGVARWRSDCRADLLLTHSSMYPSYTAVVAPVCHSREPGPDQLTVSSPPGRFTTTSARSWPHRRPTATAAAAPVPHASVSPAPRSNTRSRMCRSLSTCMNPTLTLCGKLG